MERFKFPSDWYLQPTLIQWADDNPERARQLTDEEVDELCSTFGVGGPLTMEGIEWFVSQIERKRQLRAKLEAIMGTHMIDQLERSVDDMASFVMVYADRGQQKAGKGGGK